MIYAKLVANYDFKTCTHYSHEYEMSRNEMHVLIVFTNYRGFRHG